MVNIILTDIIGTTSPNSYVKTLMQDCSKNGALYIARASPGALRIIDKIKQETGLKTGEEVIAYVLSEIDKRNLKPEFLALCGEVNVDGYKTGRLKGEFFADVPLALQRWKQNGRGIYVYSNGSEESQREMFRTASQGDLTGLIRRFFDTAEVGTKYEADSYKRIADRIQTGTRNILFL